MNAGQERDRDVIPNVPGILRNQISEAVDA